MRTLTWPGVWPGVGSSRTSAVDRVVALDESARPASMTGRTESAMTSPSRRVVAPAVQYSHSVRPKR